jgi:predicted RNA binding protein YcfA (HicA-like mRNA interferase family)
VKHLELVRTIKKLGFEEVGVTGSHRKFWHSPSNYKVVLPVSYPGKDLPKSMVAVIFKGIEMAGIITSDERVKILAKR